MRRGPTATNAGGYTVVSCPHKEFKRGAQFVRESFERTLKMGNWPNGMVVERDGKKYVVSYELRETNGREPG